MTTRCADLAAEPADAASTATIAIALGAVVIAAHGPALAAAFQFDDFAVIVDNRNVQSLHAWWASMPGIRPLLKLSYALNHAMWPSAVGFHAVNLVIHLVNALLAWRLARYWLPRLGVQAEAAAAATALLFALHPATTEAVAYASGRSISLAAMFMLAAWLADARFARSDRRISVLSPLFFALAMGVRETSLVVPLALLLLDACAPLPGRPGAYMRRHAGHVVVVFGALVAFFLLPGYQRFFAVSFETRDLATQLSMQLAAQAYLVVQPLLSLRTNIDPPLHAVLTTASPMLVASLLILLATVALGLRRRWPLLTFALGWYFLMLAPSNSLLPRLDLANDRHLYLALLGPIWLLVGTLAAISRPRLAPALVAMLAVTFGAATWLRSFDYRSEIALWTASLTSAPRNARAWTNLGYAWRQAGDRGRARNAYLCALAFDPGSKQAILNLDALDALDADARMPQHGPDACRVAPFASP